MPISAVLSYAAAYLSVIAAVAVLLRDRASSIHRLFAVGVLLFATEEALQGISDSGALQQDVLYWQKAVFVVSVLIPSIWLAFSISYARVRPQEFVSRWKWGLLSAVALPALFVAAFHHSMFAGTIFPSESGRWIIPLAWPGEALEFFSLLVSVLILFNLERTIRSSIGHMRWQIKFMVLGVGGLFALRIYLASQALLFSGLDTGFGTMNAAALLLANVLFALSITRSRTLNVDVYLSSATIQNSLTIILTGIYLLSVGVVAHLTRSFASAQSLPLDAFIVFLSLTILAVFLLSNRLRRKLRLFVGRHFRRPIHDYRNVWMELTQRSTSLLDMYELSTAVSRTVSESLETLSVSVWLADENHGRLKLAGSTAFSSAHAKKLENAGTGALDLIGYLKDHPGCLDFKDKTFVWPEEIMTAVPDFFCRIQIALRDRTSGRRRICRGDDAE